DNLISNYPSGIEENFWLMDLPSYPNTEGSVIIIDPFGDEADRFDYHEDMHFALINDPDGVSLERISASLPTNEADNWHSASSTENYATPGYLNSQDYDPSDDAAEVSLSAEIISPDNDGYQDVVSINYQFNEPGYLMSVSIYTDKGVLINPLVSNRIIGNEGSFIWNGTKENGEKAHTGIHVIMVEAFNLNNKQERFRLPIVVATKLN
ncbi:MAG: hypothetical protein WEC59_01425, partial [Salibacteraceae bacterium]